MTRLAESIFASAASTVACTSHAEQVTIQSISLNTIPGPTGRALRLPSLAQNSTDEDRHLRPWHVEKIVAQLRPK